MTVYEEQKIPARKGTRNGNSTSEERLKIRKDKSESIAKAQIGEITDRNDRSNNTDRSGTANVTRGTEPEIRDWREVLWKKYEKLGLDYVWMSRPSVLGKEFCRKALMYQYKEDDYRFTGTFYKYYPTYDDMTPETLRGYFGWRSRVRRGEYEDTPLSFIFVHTYELLEKIGADTPEEAYEQLIALRKHYPDETLRKYMDRWLNDFVIYYGLDSRYADPVLENVRKRDAEILAFYKPEEYSAEAVLRAVEERSTYNLKRSSFITKNREISAEVIRKTIIKTANYFKAINRGSFPQLCCGTLERRPYEMFKNAIFYDYKNYDDYTFVVDEFRTYYCEKGQWSCTSVETKYNGNGGSAILGMITHEADRVLRERCGFNNKIAKKTIAPELEEIVNESVEEALRERREALRPKITIDKSILNSIRSDAAETRDRLLIDEADDDTDVKTVWDAESKSDVTYSEIHSDSDHVLEKNSSNHEVTVENSGNDVVHEENSGKDEISRENGGNNLIPGENVENEEKPGDASENIYDLDKNEREFLSILANRKPFKDYLKSKNMFLSVLVESINDKLFDMFDDNVIEIDDDGNPAFVEDYEEELISELRLI